MDGLRGYSSPYNLGHKNLQGFFEGTVHIQEKIDGSQFSFGAVAVAEDEVWLQIRSHHKPILDFANAGMFQKGVDVVVDLFQRGLLIDGWTYRCEYLSKPRHNTLRYDRVPHNHLMLFDIDKGDQDYIPPERLDATAEAMGIEAVQYLGFVEGKKPLDFWMKFLEYDSVLGGTKIEGVVLKNYSRFDERDNKVMMAKLVSEVFREKHTKDWKKKNPSQNAFVEDVIQMLATEARWAKARQHLAEAGELINAPQDIPLLMREINRDVFEECADEVKEMLFKHFWKKIARGLTRGMPEWYKRVLAEEFFNDTEITA